MAGNCAERGGGDWQPSRIGSGERRPMSYPPARSVQLGNVPVHPDAHVVRMK